MRKIASRPEFNSPEEIHIIEENVRINNILAKLGVSWSTDSFLSSDCDVPRVEDSDDDVFYKRITSEYPLMIQPIRSPSDGSLIAVLDFDISDDISNTSGVQRQCSRCFP